MAERYSSLGGEVEYNSTVKEILVEKHRAVGVRMADGGEQRADVIIGAGDSRSAIFDLLGGRYVDKKIKERFENWKLLCRSSSACLVVEHELAGVQQHPK